MIYYHPTRDQPTPRSADRARLHATMSSRRCTDTQRCASHACHRSAGTLRDPANPGRPFNSLAWQQTGSDAMDGTMDRSDRWCHVADHVMMSQTRYQPSGQQKVSNGVSSGGSTAGRPVAWEREVVVVAAVGGVRSREGGLGGTDRRGRWWEKRRRLTSTWTDRRGLTSTWTDRVGSLEEEDV